MAEKVDLQAMVYTLAADIRDSKAKMAEASADVKKRMGEIERSVAKPVKVQAIKDLNGEMSQGAVLAGRLGGAIGGIATGAAVAALAALKSAMAMADKIADTSAQLQVGTTALQEYRYAILQAGGATKDADSAIGSFTKKLGAARNGSKETVAWFERLGFSQADIDSFASVDDALAAVVARIGEVDTAADRAAVADKLGLEEFIPVINRGAGALADFAKEAHEVGYVLDEDVIRKLGDAQDRADILSQAIRNDLATAFADLAPQLIQTMELIAGITSEINGMISAIQNWQVRASRVMANVPAPLRELQRKTGAWHPLGRAWLQNVEGIDPDTGALASWNSPGLQSPDRSFTVPPSAGGRTLVDPPASSRSRGSRGRSGPTAEELRQRRELAALEHQIQLARAAGDEQRAKGLEADRREMMRVQELLRDGVKLEDARNVALQERHDLYLAVLRRQQDIDSATPDKIDTNPALSPSALETFNQNWLAMSEEHEARYRDIVAGAFDALRNGGLEGFFQYFASRLGDRALEALIDATTKAALAAEASGGGSGGGFNWGSIISTGMKFFASPGTLNAGETGIAGEAGPEKFYAKPGGGVEFAGANRVRSFSMPAMPQAVARGGTTVIQNIYADQSILAGDVFRSIGEMGQAAGEYGASMGAARGASASARAQARRQARTIPR